jgi:hypothetical protein
MRSIGFRWTLLVLLLALATPAARAASLSPGGPGGIQPELVVVLLGLLAGTAGVRRASRAAPRVSPDQRR